MTTHDQLLELRKKEKYITSQIITKLQEMEDGRGYIQLGHSSLFDYLVRGLGYSESTAYQRQSCVRLSKEVPEIKEKIDSGALSFSTVTMAYKAIKNKPLQEKKRVLAKIENKSAREVKHMLLPTAPSIKVKESHYQDKVILRIELSHQQHAKFKRLKALKSHCGDESALLEALIDKELKRYENTDFKSSKSRKQRYISQRLRNHVLKRSEYKCQHTGCEQTHFLQVDHIKPVRLGGASTPDNLQVLCSAHNQAKG